MYGSYYVTIPCAAQSSGSIDGRGNSSDGLRSITPCPTIHDPPLAKARGEFNMGHFSVDIYALHGSLHISNHHPVGSSGTASCRTVCRRTINFEWLLYIYKKK